MMILTNYWFFTINFVISSKILLKIKTIYVKLIILRFYKIMFSLLHWNNISGKM